VPGSASTRLARLADGYLVTQLLHVAVALGVPEALADGPRHVPELAAEVGADPALLHRVLRGFAAENVLAEDADGRFALTPTGALLRAGVPGSLRGAVVARGSCTTPPGAVLLVVEAVLPKRAVDDPPAVRMDLHMLLLLHGRERTAAEFAVLFAGVGLDLVADVPTPARVHVLQARPRPEAHPELARGEGDGILSQAERA
jgi:hypothetical protein